MKVVNLQGRPVAGWVEFVFSLSGQTIGTELVPIASDGTLSVPTMGRLTPRLGVVKPIDGHWNLLIERPVQDGTSVCTPISGADEMMWWKAIVGRSASDPTAGQGMGIAVIDLGFQPHGSLAHVRVLDVEGDEPDLCYLPFESHGQRVCKILGERGATADREGVAPGADLFLFDVSDELMVDEFDSEKLGAAIEIAAENPDIGLINISAGSYISGDDGEYSEILKKSIEIAREHGTLVLAATGNNSLEKPALPARLGQAVGVGAIGQCDVAPPGSFMRHYQDRAVNAGGDRGALSSGEGVFHYIESSHGSGLDVVGPGIGINLRYDEGRVVEYVGTSYACPIVVGALTCALSRDAAYLRTKGRDRTWHAECVLKKMCQSLGMDPLRQGAGLPIWRPL